MTYPNERDCEHGQLRRSCNICEDKKDIEILKSALISIAKRIDAGDCDEWSIKALSTRAKQAVKDAGY